jgi:7-cyano-7-deazaguanine reductase
MNNSYSKNLGKGTIYKSAYDNSLLDPIPRALGRENLNINTIPLPFGGFDLWTAFEVSWLDKKGKPQVAIFEIIIPCESQYIIESKSLKLYLNSFNQTKISSIEELISIIEKDISFSTESNAIVKNSTGKIKTNKPIGECIDGVDLLIENYEFNPTHLIGATSDEYKKEVLYSQLLKSNCLVTNQPDWGTVFIKYEGMKINHDNLLRYIISFRLHNEFHEQCVERIYMDIKKYCKPDKLSVFARYTRRGGLDINPFRSDFESEAFVGRLENQ